MLIQITANSDESAARILEKNTSTIRDYFNEKEIARLKNNIEKTSKELQKELEEKYKIKLTIPPGFVKMKEGRKWVLDKKRKNSRRA